MVSEVQQVNLPDDFVSTVSHEMRTPLTSVKGYLELMLEEEESLADKQRHHLLVIKNNVDRLVNLLNQVLEMSRIASSSLPLNPQILDVASLLSELREALSPEFEAAGVALEVEILALDSSLVCDRDCLTRILANLLSNACKYTPSGGRTLVRAWPSRGFMVLEVADNGVGIPDEEQPRLFSKFFRGTSSRLRGSRGSGLGLAITKSLVELMGGEISFASKAGYGSTFTVQLPLGIPPSVCPVRRYP